MNMRPPFRNLLLSLVGATTWAAWSQAAAAAPNDIFTKCSVQIGGVSVIPRGKFQALADNLADSEFAEHDPQCKGKKANPEGVALSQKKRERAAARVAQDLRDASAGRANMPGASPGSIPADVARTEFGMDKPAPLPFLFRDAYSIYSLLSPPPPRERATGTQISYTRDKLAHNDIVSAKGAIIGWDVISIKSDSDNPLAGAGFTRMLLAPGIEFDQTRNRANSKKDNDYLAFKFIGELEKETAGSLFPLQYFRFSGYWKTDSRGSSQIGGAYAEWEPYNLDLAIGVAPRLFGGPVQFRWSPILHAEIEKVFDSGSLVGVHTGDAYARIGPIVGADMFFAEGPLRRLVLGAQYRYLWTALENGNVKDVRYFQTTASYNLDEAGYTALSVTYRDGVTPGNATRVKEIKSGLTIKY
jgi:hypothetical protein